MNRIAFVFVSGPHGTASGREGLDAVLATSALTKDIGVFFISDGVFQLFAGQKPQTILARDYIPTFKLLPFYDIVKFWVCASSLRKRGLPEDINMVLDVMVVEPNELCNELTNYSVILNF